MGLAFIDGDGGHLPPGAPSQTESNLLAGFSSLPEPERAYFMVAICPAHFVVDAPESVHLDPPPAVAGDTASVSGTDNYLFLLKSNAPATAANWVNLITGQPPPEA